VNASGETVDISNLRFIGNAGGEIGPNDFGFIDENVLTHFRNDRCLIILPASRGQENAVTPPLIEGVTCEVIAGTIYLPPGDVIWRDRDGFSAQVDETLTAHCPTRGNTCDVAVPKSS
jgi:hypothetical protein